MEVVLSCLMDPSSLHNAAGSADTELFDVDEFGKAFVRYIYRTAIATGRIQVKGKTTEEIKYDLACLTREYVDNPGPIMLADDHLQDLKSSLLAARNAGDDYTAILLLTTWLEHWCNQMLLYGFGSLGMSEESADLLLRELRLRTKLIALWELMEFPKIPQDHLATIEELSKQRNKFVHYKWQFREANADFDGEKLRALERGLETLAFLENLEQQIVFDGRHDEILGL